MKVHIVGITEEGHKVVGGLFHAHDTLGISLSVSVALLAGAGMVPDLHGFIRDAKAAGWSKDAVVQRVREAIVDSYGTKYYEGLASRIKQSFAETMTPKESV